MTLPNYIPWVWKPTNQLNTGSREDFKAKFLVICVEQMKLKRKSDPSKESLVVWTIKWPGHLNHYMYVYIWIYVYVCGHTEVMTDFTHWTFIGFLSIIYLTYQVCFCEMTSVGNAGTSVGLDTIKSTLRWFLLDKTVAIVTVFVILLPQFHAMVLSCRSGFLDSVLGVNRSQHLALLTRRLYHCLADHTLVQVGDQLEPFKPHCKVFGPGAWIPRGVCRSFEDPCWPWPSSPWSWRPAAPTGWLSPSSCWARHRYQTHWQGGGAICEPAAHERLALWWSWYYANKLPLLTHVFSLPSNCWCKKNRKWFHVLDLLVFFFSPSPAWHAFFVAYLIRIVTQRRCALNNVFRKENLDFTFI